MAPYQDPQIVNLTVDKKKIFDHIKMMFDDPEKCNLDVDAFLKAIEADGGGPDVGMAEAEDYEEKVVKSYLLISKMIPKSTN